MPDMENVIVARAIKEPQFRAWLLRDPRGAVGATLGTPLPAGLQVRVIEAEPNTLYLVLPARQEEIEAAGELSETDLAAVAGGISQNDYANGPPAECTVICGN